MPLCTPYYTIIIIILSALSFAVVLQYECYYNAWAHLANQKERACRGIGDGGLGVER